MKERTEVIKVNVGGIYEWGQGFLSHTMYENWYKAFREYDGIFFKKVIDSLDSIYLVGIYCGGMIHPLDGAKFYVNPNHCGSIKNECEELFNIFCKAVCPSGGTVTLYHYLENDDGTWEILDRFISD